MNSWDRVLLVVWRCTIGPVLFCLLLLCGIASFVIGGPRFFLGCWKMAMFGLMVDWDSSIDHVLDKGAVGPSGGYGVEEVNLISRILWMVLFGLWLRLLFLALMAATHLLFFSDWLAEAMLDLAGCARNPAYVKDFWTRYWSMDEDGHFQKLNVRNVIDSFPYAYEISWRSDFSKLDGNTWAKLLRMRPQFADKCDWSKLDGGNWVELLWVQPQFAEKCVWAKLNGYGWGALLSKQPQFADKCDWSKLDDYDWNHLLDKQPQFASMRDNKSAEMEDGDRDSLIKAQPQLTDKRDNKSAEMEDGDRDSLIKARPQLTDKRDKWEEMDGYDWADLLANQPQFADKCDWEKLDGFNWTTLLADQPQFADKCDWQKLVGCDWAYLLQSQPQFADRCDKWAEMDGSNWANLLANQPQFADKCDKWDEFSDDNWNWLLEEQPQFADRRGTD